MGSGRLRRDLVEGFEVGGSAQSPAVRRAFLALPRERFLPETAKHEGLERVYQDQAIVTAKDGRGIPTSSSSQPSLMAAMLERLDLGRGQRVLEVGAGTGYNAALLARVVGARGEVVSVELDPATARRARRALGGVKSRARVVRGDGREGWPRGAPYDRIIVTASARSVERAWYEQLADGGLLELPLVISRASSAQAIITFRKLGETLRSEAFIYGGFMALREAPGAPLPPQPPSLSANEWTGDPSPPLVYLGGESLRRLSRERRRQLLSLALSKPRTRPLGVRAPRPGLYFYLAVEAPEQRFVGGSRLGVISQDGEGLALLAGGAKTFSRIESYGDGDAERLLLDLIEGWKQRGRPTGGDLRLEVRCPDSAASELSLSWNP